MKKRILAAVVLLLAAGVSLWIALQSLEGVNQKMEISSNTQTTMEKKATPTPEPTSTPKPQPSSTPTPEPSDPEIPVLTLASDTLEISVGQSFDVVSQVADITDDKDDRSSLFRRIRVKGVFDINIPGEYTLEYYVTDADGHESQHKQLKLVVKAS